MTLQKMYEKFMDSVVNSAEFQKLSKIGGHKVYHLEGDALKHSLMVVEEAKKMFPNDYKMWLVALLHDIGKIYTSVCNGPDDWSYPNHAKAGAEHLAEFIPENHPDYKAIEWYIANHIKPLFWRGKKDKTLRREIFLLNCPEGCSIVKLAKLAICDIQGSRASVSQDELLAFLYKFVEEREFAIEEAHSQGLEFEVETYINCGLSPDEALEEWDL